MKYAAVRWLAVVVSLISGSLARADYIAQFNFEPDKTTLFATNNPSLGYITLSDQSPSKIEGTSTLIATNISTWASNTTNVKTNPAIFNNAAFNLTLTITDFGSNKTGTMSFSGRFDGKLSQGSALIYETPTSPTTLTQTIGSHIYTVTIGPYVPPGNPTSGTVGSLGALATIKVSSVPEPSAVVLAGLGVFLVGGVWWHRRRALAVNPA